MKKLHIVLMLLFFALNVTYATTNVESLEAEAASMYKEGNYQKAIDLYNEILSGDLESATLYYNLGNCYYKLGEIGKAILNYERALLLHPGDSDAKYNLTMAQKSTVDNIKVLPELFFVRWYNAFVTTLTADQWAYVSVALFIGFLIMAGLFFYATSASLKKSWFTLGVVMLLLSVMTIFIALKQYHRVANRDYGIVMTPSVVVRGAPDNSGTELFVVHEGLKVRVIGNLGDWYNVRLADGNEGWVTKSDVEKI